MKKFVPILILLFSISLNAQRAIKITPKKCIHKKEFYLRLKSVFDDSRCPERVTCIWAGEVSATIEVYKDKKMVEERNLTFNTENKAENARWFEKYFPKRIKGIGVMPYPKEGITTNPKKQYISVVFVD